MSSAKPRIDTLAVRLMPLDCQDGLVPLEVPGDGNCLFHAVAMALKANGVGTYSSKALRDKAAQEMSANKKKYAEQLWDHAVGASRARLTSFHPVSLVKSCLSKAALYAYECNLSRGGTDAEIVHAIEQSLETEAASTLVGGTWSSMPQIFALSSVVEADINVVYPDVNKELRSFFHTTVKPLISTKVDPKTSISIMWSSVAPTLSKEGFVRLNHFVPLTWNVAAQCGPGAPMPNNILEPQPKTTSTPKKSKHPAIHKPQQLKLGDFFVPKLSKQKSSKHKKSVDSFDTSLPRKKKKVHTTDTPMTWEDSSTADRCASICPSTTLSTIDSDSVHSNCSDDPSSELLEERDTLHTRTPKSPSSKLVEYAHPSSTVTVTLSANFMEHTRPSLYVSTMSPTQEKEVAKGHEQSTLVSNSGYSLEAAKRQVPLRTFQKWQSQYEQEYTSLSWLRCHTDRHRSDLVNSLWCEVCTKYESSIWSLKNFSRAWLTGSLNQRTSNIVSHAESEQHKIAMRTWRAEQVAKSRESLASYAPIAKSLHRMKVSEHEKMRKKFDLCYLLAKENIAFRKYPSLVQLEKRHGVDMGTSYLTKASTKDFIHYIAESQRLTFRHTLKDIMFYSIAIDGSTDAGNIEDELVMIQYGLIDDKARRVKSVTRFLSVEAPARGDADGLINCLETSLKPLGISDITDASSVLANDAVIVGVSTDGAAVNIAVNGMKGKLQAHLPWLHWQWCYAHRLELACKDSFRSQVMTDLTELLLRLYYLYSKSPKKSRDLTAIVEDLQEVYHLPKGGSIPVRSQGTRWIAHKRKALQRFVDKYGAYVSHLSSLVEDKNTKSVDRARLSGYLRKMRQWKTLLGAALYIDLLKPVQILSLSLQGDHVNVVHGIRCLLRSSESLKSLRMEDPLKWPTVKRVLKRIKQEGSENLYQGAPLVNYTDSYAKACASHVMKDLECLCTKMRERLEWSDTDSLGAIVAYLDTQTWFLPASLASSALQGCIDSDEEEKNNDKIMERVLSATELLSAKFQKPLEAKNVNPLGLIDEVEEVVLYARNYLGTLCTESYETVWYHLHTCSDHYRWSNVLKLSQLLFSLPFTTSSVERTFSTLKVIKTDRRTRLRTHTLSDLLEIHSEGPSLEDFHADDAVELWWEAATRRPKQRHRRKYICKTRQCPSDTSASESDAEGTKLQQPCLNLRDWDNWLHAASGKSSDSSGLDSD